MAKARTNKSFSGRERSTAEISTPDKPVNEMLDQLPEHVWQSGHTFLDPACGSIDHDGFVPWALRRKLAHGCMVMEALKDIHGVELRADNLDECRRRLLAIVVEHEQVTINHILVVLTNVRQGDTLKDPIGTDAWWVPVSREEAVEWCGINQLCISTATPPEPPASPKPARQ